ncbi:MAG: hypothetical protein HZB26_08460 [Candidatus Hydrogenedentes bacterium]|nr:hypothetical protein [Candidatus Hydrogenedentota bacterium]
MKAYGIFMIICGVVIIACMIQELVTDSVKAPTLLFVGPLSLAGGIYAVIRASRKGVSGKRSED